MPSQFFGGTGVSLSPWVAVCVVACGLAVKLQRKIVVPLYVGAAVVVLVCSRVITAILMRESKLQCNFVMSKKQR